MSKKSLSLRVQRQLVAALLRKHPLPWKIDYDWTVEVLDAKGACVIKLMSEAEALAFIAFAKVLAAEHIKAEAEINKLLEDSDADPA